MLKKSKYRGITTGNVIEVFLLMYADHIVLVGDTVLELQRKINILEICYKKWGMEVNLKGQIRSKNKLRSNERA